MQDRIEIAYDASPGVRCTVERFGRTEDLTFSPDNRRVVLTSADDDSLALVDVEVVTDGDRPTVTVTDAALLTAPGLAYPHSAVFLDDDTIVVANRYGSVTVFRLLSPGRTASDTELIPLELPAGGGFESLHGPSSLAIAHRADGDTEVLTGHLTAPLLTRHVVHADASGTLRVTSNDVLLRQGFKVVDGMSTSPDGAWLALSNPWHQNVLVYDLTSALDEGAEPDCILRGARYPHGVHFSADGRRVFVADAGSPYLHVHARDGATWRGVQYPEGSVRVMDDEQFQRGHCNSSEGGPKGVDVDRSGRVLTLTSKYQPLAFLDVAAVLDRSAETGDDRDRRLQYELGLVRAGDGLLQDHMARLTGSTSYRVAEQLRRVAAIRKRFLPPPKR